MTPALNGDRSEVSGNIRSEIGCELHRLDLPCSIPGSCLIKIPGKDTGYQPDIVVLERSSVSSEPRWQEASVVLNSASVRLAIELVDENSRENCAVKCRDYENMGISEYWIAEYQGCGKDSIPCLAISCLKEGGYTVKKFVGGEAIESPVFPYFLNLTVDRLFSREN